MENIWSIILTTSYQATIVGILILSIKYLLKDKLSPRWGYLLWVVFLIKLVMPFGPESEISVFNTIPKISSERIVIENNYTDSNISTSLNKENKTIENEPRSIEKTIVNKIDGANNKWYLSSYIPYIWLAGAINVLLLFIVVYTALNIKLGKNKIDYDKRLDRILDIAREKTNTGNKIKLVVSDDINTPALSGILSPKILLPLKMINLEDKELEYIFLHELSHYKRKDILINYIMIVIKSIHWFNPIIWYLLEKVRDDIELATDENVLRILENREHKDYARSIISVIEKSNQSLFYPTLMSMASDKKKIEKRIRSIKVMKNIKNKTVLFTIVGVLVIGIAAPIMLTTSKAEEKTPEIKKEIDNEKDSTTSNKDIDKSDKYYTDEYRDNLRMIDDISYSPEKQPKRLSMEDSIKYVKDNIGKDAKEISGRYIVEAAMTQVVYKVGDKEYVAMYYHPQVDDGNPYDKQYTYDKEHTDGIFVYESVDNK